MGIGGAAPSGTCEEEDGDVADEGETEADRADHVDAARSWAVTEQHHAAGGDGDREDDYLHG
ncbi:hypothetical protein Csp2054_01505 [Curtobacterium sp. 'Ferrero']|nr:hypothetical protein Csp2054_01505 [Curtobacterium sp. 'Ferrero']